MPVLSLFVRLSLCVALLGSSVSAASPAADTPSSSVHASAFLCEAVPAPLAASEVHPITPRARLSYLRAFSDLSRRDFWRAAAGAGLAFLGVRSLSAMGWQDGVGSIYHQSIPFKAFSPAALQNEEMRAVLKEVSGFIGMIRESRRMGRAGVYTADHEAQFEEARYQLALTLYGLPGIQRALREQLARNKRQWADTPERRANQILYSALPAYFAQHGLLLNWLFPRPERREAWLPELEKRHVFENLGLYPIDRVESATVSLWGTPVSANQLFVSGPLVTNGQPMVSEPIQIQALSMYDNAIYFEPEVVTSIAAEKGSEALDPKVLPLAKVEWERAIEAPQFRENPLLFAGLRLSAEGMAAPLSDGERSRMMRQGTRAHEFQHLSDARRGIVRYQAPPRTWDAYERQIHGGHVAAETSGILAEMRYAGPGGARRRLRQMINQVDDARHGRSTRLIFYNLLHEILTEIAAAPSAYPAIRLQVRSDISLRGQIAGQLYRLSEADLHRVLEGIHARRLKNPAVLMPSTFSRLTLVQGPPYRAPTTPPKSRPTPPAVKAAA
jgi:hypothetical protein